MIAGVDQQNAVARRNRDACRLPRRVADRIDTSILSAIELRDDPAFKIERAHAAVVRVGDQDTVAVGSDAERMLQAGGAERAIGLAELEQAGSDDRLRLVLVTQSDRADCRTFRVGDIQRVAVAAERQTARLRKRRYVGQAGFQVFRAAPCQPRDRVFRKVENADLVRTGIGQIQRVALLFEIPR